MELSWKAIVAWSRHGEASVAKIALAHNECAAVFCAGNVVGMNANPVPGEMFVRVTGSAKGISLDPAKTGCDGVPYSVGDVVVFSPKYHSGVPCLSAFRFPAP